MTTVKKILLLAITAMSMTLSAQDMKIINPTFLGNEQRNFYGNEAPDNLKLNWKKYLGKGKTTISRRSGEREWAGAGWTGQPLMVKENGELFLIQGCFDHNLKKMKAKNGEIVWQSKFSDVLKGTGTIWHNKNAKEKKNELVIMQGSRLGYGKYLDTKIVPSFRAVSYHTGEQLWTKNVKYGVSYSRDVDASALVINDTAYIGLENGRFIAFDPNYKNAKKEDKLLQPKIYEKHWLYRKGDAKLHKGNLVTEASPCRLNDHIYIASGSGHVFGYNLKTRKIDWEFFIGSDIDGSAVVTQDNCILVSVEKQYIKGQGGLLKLNPKKKGKEAVVWYLPVKDKKFNTWLGGIIGSPAVRDIKGKKKLAAVSAIDGYLYLVEHNKLGSKKVLGFDSTTVYPSPVILDKYKIGPSISTPLIIGDKLIAAGYNGINLFDISNNKLKRIAKFPVGCEATPFVHNKKVYIASRNGYFYCLGK